MFNEKVIPTLKNVLKVNVRTSEKMRNFRNSEIEGEVFATVARNVAAETEMTASDVLDLIMFEHDADVDQLLEELADELEIEEELEEDELLEHEADEEWLAEMKEEVEHVEAMYEKIFECQD